MNGGCSANARQADPCLALAAMVEVHEAQAVDGGVAVVPTGLGWDRIAQRGKAAMVACCEQQLASGGHYGDAKRAWHFVTTVPHAGRCRPMHPCWTCLAADETTWQGEAIVGDDLAVLQGHFPGEPIVPGVAQLFWAAALARLVFPACDQALTGEVRGLKFKRAIRPGVRLRVALTFNDVDQPRHVAFGYRSDGVHSHGRLLLDPAGYAAG